MGLPACPVLCGQAGHALKPRIAYRCLSMPALFVLSVKK
jgi:hypothetical protein